MAPQGLEISGQAGGHEADHGDLDHGFGVFGVAFVVPVQSVVPCQPDEGAGAFDHPASGLQLKA